MKWTLVDPHGLDVVLKPLAKRRVFRALEKLQDSSYGLTQTPTWQLIPTPGAYRQSEPLKALFFPAREPTGCCNKAAEPVLCACHGEASSSRHSGGSAKWL